MLLKLLKRGLDAPAGAIQRGDLGGLGREIGQQHQGSIAMAGLSGQVESETASALHLTLGG